MGCPARGSCDDTGLSRESSCCSLNIYSVPGTISYLNVLDRLGWSWVVELVPGMCEALSSLPSTAQ